MRSRACELSVPRDLRYYHRRTEETITAHHMRVNRGLPPGSAILIEVTEADCPCGSGATYDACCGPLHRGHAAATTAEALMRSRYSAYAVGAAEYLRATWHPATRPATVDLDPALEWRRLQIHDVTGGTAADDVGTVDFVAHYWDASGRRYGRQHENSRFVRQGDVWLYVEPAH